MGQKETGKLLPKRDARKNYMPQCMQKVHLGADVSVTELYSSDSDVQLIVSIGLD